jgi:hypothetical protein
MTSPLLPPKFELTHLQSVPRHVEFTVAPPTDLVSKFSTITSRSRAAAVLDDFTSVYPSIFDGLETLLVTFNPSYQDPVDYRNKRVRLSDAPAGNVLPPKSGRKGKGRAAPRKATPVESESSSDDPSAPLPSLAVIHVSQDPHPDQAFVQQLYDNFRGKVSSSELAQLQAGVSSYVVSADANLNVEVGPPGSDLWEDTNDGRKVILSFPRFSLF